MSEQAVTSRRRTAKPKLRPTICEKMELPANLRYLDYKERPMVWEDVPRFAQPYQLAPIDVMYHLGFNTTYQYNAHLDPPSSRQVVPFDVEVLIMMYERCPTPCSWERPNVREIFDQLYSPLIAQISEPYREVARMQFGARYARLVDRSPTVVYRWLSFNGQTSRRTINILAKVREIALTHGWDEARTVFESIARDRWALRGYDLDADQPYPTEEALKARPSHLTRLTGSVSKRLQRGNAEYTPGAFTA